MSESPANAARAKKIFVDAAPSYFLMEDVVAVSFKRNPTTKIETFVVYLRNAPAPLEVTRRAYEQARNWLKAASE